ncbi:MULTISPECIES: 3-oxoadipyl-CoA thiolase [unclassified Ensifer]|uniref:3-oxoadipyl-CoA thiolase n=1 Tax=unclassified Ensifer TaxID=2633371 RepID=UPI000813A8D8|nr:MULTISPECIES: 3-oxoadipyl-CoA thiolase [unclassified Ensifer]OCP10067.1 3-oxoadipyl-CoA thiolase [Ensifer sp. LC14]OCP12270.1 3-oxoadipyl-CoA thiolase [Ensifer sp. LC13]OCP13086.1 3-oxoadipyl-CoA thiolase [Ensifer sp. LC11]OCP33831.1 3-oxoadipyl-CoA thiolase [Ensifer sp. LC499]
MSEAYIIGGVRTPIGRYGGALSSARADDLAAHVIRETLTRVASVPAEEIDEVVLGCANQAGEDNRNVARMAALLAGLPDTVAGTTINRLCGSGLDAVGYAARAIRLGEAEIIVAGGVESMSRAPFVMPKAEGPFQRSTEIHDTTIGWRFVNPVMKVQYGIDSMPETAENVAAEYSISREDQDGFALRSQARTAAALKSGRFAQEIAPYPVKGRKGETMWVEHDEHPRETTIEKLASLPTPFRANGTVTAGNASGVNDGAAALILASGHAVERYGLQPLARVAGMATAGVPPRIMGIGPVFSTQKLLQRLGFGIGDIDLFELNEAFAAQALACLRQLGLADDAPHVNPNGGAIALGHPLGMSGARLALTAALELEHQGAKRAIATMCIGVGQGISMLLTRP